MPNIYKFALTALGLFGSNVGARRVRVLPSLPFALRDALVENNGKPVAIDDTSELFSLSPPTLPVWAGYAGKPMIAQLNPIN